MSEYCESLKYSVKWLFFLNHLANHIIYMVLVTEQ